MSKKASIPLIAAVTVIAGLLVAGCGGGDDSESLSKAEFVKQADAVCDSAKKKLLKESEATADIVGSTLVALKIEEEELGDLGTPSGDKGEVEKILGKLRKTIDAIEENPPDLNVANEELALAEELAVKYGLESCLVAEEEKS